MTASKKLITDGTKIALKTLLSIRDRRNCQLQSNQKFNQKKKSALVWAK